MGYKASIRFFDLIGFTVHFFYEKAHFLQLLLAQIRVISLACSADFNPIIPRTLSVEANAFGPTDHQIRLAVQKSAEVPVDVVLRNKGHDVLYQHSIGKKEGKYAVKLTIHDLADGEYELEIKSSEGSIVKQLTVSSRPVLQAVRTIAMN